LQKGRAALLSGRLASIMPAGGQAATQEFSIGAGWRLFTPEALQRLAGG
jgi:hypothetical protein